MYSKSSPEVAMWQKDNRWLSNYSDVINATIQQLESSLQETILQKSIDVSLYTPLTIPITFNSNSISTAKQHMRLAI